MKQEKHSKKKNKAIVVIFVIVIIALLILGVVLGIKMLGVKEEEGVFDNRQFGSNGNAEAVLSDVVYAYGITSIGTTSVEFPIEDMENRLEIEEIYISSGDTIENGTALFKLTEDSVEAVRVELEETLRDAGLAYRAGYIEYKQSLITAYYDKESTLLSGKQADEVYNETIANLYDEVESTKAALDEAKEQIAEYKNAIANNTYYEEYQVAYYKEIYDENLEILKKRIDEWGVSWSEVTSGRSGQQMSNGSSMGGMTSANNAVSGGNSVSGGDSSSSDLHSQYVTVLSSLYSILEQNLADYEQALSSYEEASENASFNLQTLQLELSSLEQKYTEARQNYETNILQAELTKETTLYNSDMAEKLYDTNVEKAEADFEELTEALEEAQSNLDIFNEVIKDYCYYAQEDGTILRVSLRDGGEIGAGSNLYTLSNWDEMTVTVSVDQANIASVKVGDSVVVQSTESGMYSGTVTAISPMSSSGSKTSISYSVTVEMGGDIKNLSTNETVVVYFGIGNGAESNE